MRRSFLLVIVALSLGLFSPNPGWAGEWEYWLVPVNLEIGPRDSTVEVDVYFRTGFRVKSFFVPLFAEGTSNPVLDTVLTGGLADTNPPAFVSPSFWMLNTRVVNPYGPPSDPLYFLLEDSVGYAGPTWGIFCKMFYKVSGTGTLTFRTAVHSKLGAVHMIRYENGDTLPLSWPSEGQVGNFDVIPYSNKYSIEPVALRIAPDGGTVQFNINISTRDTIQLFKLPLYAEGTSNPVLDTVLTGGLSDPDPPAFAVPSLVSDFATRYVNPYGPPSDPLIFMADDIAHPLPPDTGLWCTMFYKVSGPGTLVFRTAVHSTAGAVSMIKPDSTSAPVNWPSAGMIDSFDLKVNEYTLSPVDLDICPCDSLVEVDINIDVVDHIVVLRVPLFAEGTSNPVLDTVMTGGLGSASPPAFNPPSLAAGFTLRGVMPYGPPTIPMLFWAFDTGGGIQPQDSGLFCKMFYKVSGPGTLTFRTAVHPTGGAVGMWEPEGPVPINWPAEGQVGSFDVVFQDSLHQHGNVNCDGLINVADVVYIISYLFKSGPSPNPLESGDANCDGQVTIADVVYLINYLFKSGPPPC